MDPMMAFVRARLDEDEAGIRALKVPHDWHTGPGDDPDWTDEELVCMWPPEFHTPYEQDKHWRGITISGPELAAYVARHDPARVLREVEAKRQIAERHGPTPPGYTWVGDDEDRMPACRTCGDLTIAFPCATLRLLAAPYADHADYLPEWKLA